MLNQKVPKKLSQEPHVKIRRKSHEKQIQVVIHGVISPYNWPMGFTVFFSTPFFCGVISPTLLITGDFGPIL